MKKESNDNTDKPDPRELTPEEARKKRDYHLALAAAEQARVEQSDTSEVDSADASMATMILPGGD